MAAAGIDVSGLTLPEATNRIAFLVNTHMNSPLSSRVAGRRFLMRPKEVGFKFDQWIDVAWFQKMLNPPVHAVPPS